MYDYTDQYPEMVEVCVLKALDTILIITQYNCWHKNLLGNEQWRDVDSIKYCEVM